jgi:hypothetical protein
MSDTDFDYDSLEEYPLSYQEFYAELPRATDYLNEIDPTIYDEHDDEPESVGGLSAEQVDQISRDSLGDNAAPSFTPPQDEPRLFSSDDE